MCGRDDVGWPQRPAAADRRRLLPDRQVHEARHLAVAVEPRDAFLEAADEQHAPVHLDQVGAAHGHACTVTTGTRPAGAERGRRSRALVGRCWVADVSRRTVVINGAGGALGGALSRVFATEADTDLVLSDLSKEALDDTVAALPAERGDVETLAADVSDFAQGEAVVAR